MKLYKPTIYRHAAELLLNSHYGYCCPALGKVIIDLSGSITNYYQRDLLLPEFAGLFKPEHAQQAGPWFDSLDIETRVIAMLFMAEITKGQYITLPIA